ncbi:MAG: VCBS repeat-containing protein [Aureliella sp.]
MLKKCTDQWLRLAFLVGFLALLPYAQNAARAQPVAREKAESEWKLQQLRYNNPGLVVDLGVGLWADPLPLDYDQDGDMDLLVSCPDKPSSGIYLFENPSNDPAVKMPTFKPGVRISRTHKYLMLSMVDDEPVVLRPGKVYRRTAEGVFDFDSPENIAVVTNPAAESADRIRGNMWRMVDYDGDGDQDIAVGIGDWTQYAWDHAYDSNGRWQNGPLHGWVYIAINSGSDDAPNYSKPQRVQAAGGDVDVYGWPCPNFGDFDADGDLDLLCGEFLDGFSYFENIGSRQHPRYAAARRLVDDAGQPMAMDLQMITPTAIDWDRDGDLDLVVGDEDGRVALIEHTGAVRDSLPVFAAPQYFQQEADTLKFGALATPFAYDWDADGDQDLLCGNTAGYIGLFENLGPGPGGLPKWARPRNLEIADGKSSRVFRVLAGESGSIQGPAEAKWGYTTLCVADWDSDGDADIVYNSILAKVGWLRNDDGRLVDAPLEGKYAEMPPQWYWWKTNSKSALTQWRTTPFVVDWDADGIQDLVMLDQEGFLTLRRSGGKAERIFVDGNDTPWQLNPGTCGRSGRVKLCVVDWDGDGLQDVLVNSENACWYRNCGLSNGLVVLKKVGNLARRNVSGHTSSPCVCDFNSDGVPDLLVGSENGRIYYLPHDESIQFTSAQLQPSAKAPNKLTMKGSAESSTVDGGLPIAEEFIFSNPPFNECHASTICETSRGLVASWFGGTEEGEQDVVIWTSYHDGNRWSRPTVAADGVQHADLRYPCWNPVLYQPPGDSPTLLFFKVGPSPSEWWGEMMVSYDRGRTFVNQVRLPSGVDGPVRCKPMLLADGKTLLCGSSTEYDGWRVHFESVSLTDGVPTGTWRRVGPIDSASELSAIQPTLLRHSDSRIQALCRTREGVIATTTSSDQGATWSKLEKTNLPNPNSGIESVTLADGRHLLIYNHLGSRNSKWGRRGLLNIAISDDGQQWKKVGILEQERGAEFSYPAAIQSRDGKVHIIYTHKRKNIRHVTIDPDQIR